MSYTTLIIQDHAGVRRLTIDRADKLNALNRQVLAELAGAVQQARHDDSVRVLVLSFRHL